MKSASSRFEKLVKIMQTLRDPDTGCPWDQQQTFSTIAPYTLEEAYEVVDAIERNDMAELCEELGDLLFQVVYHAQMANEQGLFTVEDVVGSINTKLVQRHPHVFEQQQDTTAEAVKAAWDAHKAQEREAKNRKAGAFNSILDGIDLSLPALTRAGKIQHRAAQVGFDWAEIKPIFDKVLEELDEVRDELGMDSNQSKIEEEIGDLYFAVTNLARRLKIDPETAVRKANKKFDQRFRHIETTLSKQGREVKDVSLDELDALWEQAKSAKF